MTEATQNNSADRNRTFHLKGTISNIEVRSSKSGTPYTIANFTTTLQGKEVTHRAVAIGKAHDAMGRLVDGPCHLFVKINGGVFSVIGLHSQARPLWLARLISAYRVVFGWHKRHAPQTQAASA